MTPAPGTTSAPVPTTAADTTTALGTTITPPTSTAPTTTTPTTSAPVTTTRSEESVLPGSVPSITAGTTSGLSPSGPAGAGGATVELTGTVEAGVERGCLVLLDSEGLVLATLTGRPMADYPLGAMVTVTGRFQQGVMTTCQQGMPFQVSSISAR